MYCYDDGKNKLRVHNECLPVNFRMIIVGPTGCGKTTLLMRLLLEKNLLNYDKLYVFSKSLYQPEYECLIEGFKNNLPKNNIAEIIKLAKGIRQLDSSIEEAAYGIKVINDKKGVEPSEIEAEFHKSPDDIPEPKDLDKSIRNLIVFDDIMMDNKQTTAEKYYTQSRSANCDCIYLSQNYTKLPLHSIRSNANFFIIFKSANRVVEQLHRDFSSIDLSATEFKQLCAKTWKEKFNFLVIDLTRDDDDKNRFRNKLELIL
jgi:GTPase SAR1 family protein